MEEIESFEDLRLRPEILRAIKEMGFEEPTPIQKAAIPPIIQGRDVMGQAQTGTGKTAAFGLPLIQKVEKGKGIQVVVLTPTRELATQVSEEINRLSKYAGIHSIPIYGGQAISVQESKLKKKPEIITATPGRLIDMTKRGLVHLDKVRFFVLDEADRMLDMGFIEDIKWVLDRVPDKRQLLMFSATLPIAIVDLADTHLRNPVYLDISQDTLVVPDTDQSYFIVGRRNKLWALCRILDNEKSERVLIFCQTKRMVAELNKRLRGYGYTSEEIHGDLSQAKREEALGRFKSGRARILVATDVAARGLDIPEVDLVVNYDTPEYPEIYVHRIGRTGRAGHTGRAITFVTQNEKHLLDKIIRFAGRPIEEGKIPRGQGRDRVKRRVDFDEKADTFGMVKFVMNIGKRDGAAMNDVIKHITSHSRITDMDIGKISIGEENTEVSVHKNVAMEMVKRINGSKFKGRTINLRY